MVFKANCSHRTSSFWWLKHNPEDFKLAYTLTVSRSLLISMRPEQRFENLELMCLITSVLNASCKIALKNATVTVLETSSLKYIHGHKDKFEYPKMSSKQQEQR